MSTGCDLPGTLRTGAPSKYAEKRCASNVAEDTTHRNLIPSFLNATAAFTKPNRTSVSTLRSWASSSTMVRYFVRRPSPTHSRTRTPSVMKVSFVDRWATLSKRTL